MAFDLTWGARLRRDRWGGMTEPFFLSCFLSFFRSFFLRAVLSLVPGFVKNNAGHRRCLPPPRAPLQGIMTETPGRASSKKGIHVYTYLLTFFLSYFLSSFLSFFLTLFLCFFVSLFLCFFQALFVCLFVCLFGWLFGWLVGSAPLFLERRCRES